MYFILNWIRDFSKNFTSSEVEEANNIISSLWRNDIDIDFGYFDQNWFGKTKLIKTINFHPAFLEMLEEKQLFPVGDINGNFRGGLIPVWKILLQQCLLKTLKRFNTIPKFYVAFYFSFGEYITGSGKTKKEALESLTKPLISTDISIAGYDNEYPLHNGHIAYEGEEYDWYEIDPVDTDKFSYDRNEEDDWDYILSFV